ncbi:MAG: hypothetical protein PF439_09445 [Helicobacteraceae bacterium]|jgi:hypothetical protein|nr:hypothetical protein [Helicobacteraceae bacterium]
MKRWLIATVLMTIIALTMFCFPNPKQERVMVFPKWKKSYDLTKGTIESDAHNGYVEIFLNKTAVDAYVDVEPMFPAGAEVFKPLYRDT